MPASFVTPMQMKGYGFVEFDRIRFRTFSSCDKKRHGRFFSRELTIKPVDFLCFYQVFMVWGAPSYRDAFCQLLIRDEWLSLSLLTLNRVDGTDCWWPCNVKMYNQREPLKYGSMYLPRQTSNSRRFKNGPRPFMSRPSDFIIVAVFVVASGVGSMWFISRLPHFFDGASSIYDRATTVTLTWGTPSMWWLFVNLIVGAIVVSSGFVSAFSSSSGTDPYQPVYIEKDISDPAAPGVRLDSSSDIPEDSVESYGDEAFRSYVKPAKPKVAVPIPYSKLKPVHEVPPVYEAIPMPEAKIHTDERGTDKVGLPQNVEIHPVEIAASLSGKESVPLPSEPPVGYPVPLASEPARSVEVEVVEPELFSSRSIPPPVVLQGEPELASRNAEPEVVMSRSIPLVGVPVTEKVEDAASANQEKVVEDPTPVRTVEPNEGGLREDAEPPVAYPPPPSFYDPFPTIVEAPLAYVKLQRNFTEGSVNYVKPDEPLISAPPPKAELVKAHTFTSSRGIRREQIDSYVEPLAKKLEEMKRNEEMKRRDEIKKKNFYADPVREDVTRRGFHAESGFYAERVRTRSRDVPVEPVVRDTRPAKIHSRNPSVDVTSKDIPHSYPTEVFFPPPVQTLPPGIAHYFTSAHQAPPADAELRQVTPAPPPAFIRPKKVVPPEERPVSEWATSKKSMPAEVAAAERMGSSRKQSPTDIRDREWATSKSRKQSPTDIREREWATSKSRKQSPTDVRDREWATSKKSMPAEVPVVERMGPSRKQSPTDIRDSVRAEQAPYVATSHRLPPRKPSTTETVSVESVPARSTTSKKSAAVLETLADKLKGIKKAPADGLSDLLARAPASKKSTQTGGTERDASKQASQMEDVQRPVQRPSFPVQTPLQAPVPPVIRTSPPPSPLPAQSIRRQVSLTPSDDSPPRSPLILRPPPPPPLNMPSPLDDKDPYTSSDDVPRYGFYGPEGRNPSHKNEATSSADVFGRPMKYTAPKEGMSRRRRRVTRPPPPPESEPSVSDGTESEIVEEGKETDEFQKQIDSFLAKMHRNLALERQESMARRKGGFSHEI
ncbi:hypothetical protein R1sor_018610 [Riccia sorocarpa]|uniref:Uncharacterized protein n=1 Tax=Riccia sorocarpa TaxID=122646 RepID=A0ABD3IA70_9MARC